MKLIMSILLLACSLGWIPRAQAQVENTTCVVLANTDQESDFLSFRRKLVYFNRDTYRLCTEKILFDPEYSYNIKATDTYEISNSSDQDFDGDGNNLVIDGHPLQRTSPALAGSILGSHSTVIDASGLSPDKCVFEVWIDDVVMTHLTIIAHKKSKAICDYGNDNDFSGVKIIALDPA